ncbi:MAG: lysylphosphatidylglycerol synthase transmembrane domain-containing protein [Acidobacteriota bacterium]
MSTSGGSASGRGTSTVLAWVLGLAISGFFFYLAARGVDWRRILDVLPGFDDPVGLALVAAACLCSFLRMPARAWRWRLLVQPLAPVSLRRLTAVTTLGTALDNLLPARAGDFARAGLLRRDGLKASSAFATIVVERVVDVAATQILLVAALLAAPLPPWLWRLGAVTCAIALSALAAMGLALRRRKHFEALLRLFSRRLPGEWGDRLDALAAAFLDGFEAASPRPHVGGLFWGSLVIHVTNVLPPWLILVACGVFDGADGAVPGLVVATFVAFAVMLPAAPGQVGTVHYATVSALALFGVDAAPALAAALLYHASQNVPITVVGVLMFGPEGSAWRRSDQETPGSASGPFSPRPPGGEG